MRKLSKTEPGLFWNITEQVSGGQVLKLPCHTALRSEMVTYRCAVAYKAHVADTQMDWPKEKGSLNL